MINGILKELREKIPFLNGRVYGIIDLSTAMHDLKVNDFTLYVTELEQSNIKNNTSTSSILHKIEIFAVLPLNAEDERGEAALDYLSQFRDCLLSYLWGYRVNLGTFEPMIYNGNKFISVKNGLAIQVYEFSVIEHLSKSCFREAKYYNWELSSMSVNECGGITTSIERENHE